MAVPAGQTAPLLASDLGLQHFAVYCDDVHAAALRFAAAGGTLLTDPKPLLGIEEADGNAFCYGRAPWGTVIELITWPSNAEWTKSAPASRYKPAA